MIKPDESVLIAILNLKKNRDWGVFYTWLENCLIKANARLVDGDDKDAMLRDQGCVRALKFLVKHIDESKPNFDLMRKNTA